MHVFIDTNILLNFFHFTKDELSALGDVFASHERGAAKVHLTVQVRDEFRRNREKKISDALKKYKETVRSVQFPSFMKPYEQYTEIRSLSNKMQAASKELLEKLNEDISTKSLHADQLISKIFEESDFSSLPEEYYARAKARMDMGNPPGKNGSIGDAINWLILLDKVPETEDLHIISEDGDFYSILDDSKAHPFLIEEWKEKKNSELHTYRTLDSFLKARFDGIEFSYDSKKEELIDDLKCSGSFATTHYLIGKLEQFSYYSLSEVERILEAALENGQFGGIVTDYDVSDFLNRVAAPHLDRLRKKEHKEIIKDVIEEKSGRNE
ncbi:DUF4935 domain-containing protein [Pelagicoccus sp. NFK12]|uniref:DUF4935 domain-containing protein n=1 Tax=Pelagicoccus enzymogenes TaxID=2773457 RepID=A0A927F8G3_9BACT|nr:PIN domain-containing protein [Pelagicoccus enzymogenes]MBD5779651.1 DUF4935 domain-containing protein [Pelagicoccus enzymogenes]